MSHPSHVLFPHRIRIRSHTSMHRVHQLYQSLLR
jgi:hypothetical protein